MANTQRDCAGVGQPVKNQNLRGPLSPPAAKTASSCSAFSVGPWTRGIFFLLWKELRVKYNLRKLLLAYISLLSVKVLLLTYSRSCWCGPWRFWWTLWIVSRQLFAKARRPIPSDRLRRRGRCRRRPDHPNPYQPFFLSVHPNDFRSTSCVQCTRQCPACFRACTWFLSNQIVSTCSMIHGSRHILLRVLRSGPRPLFCIVHVGGAQLKPEVTQVSDSRLLEAILHYSRERA